MQFTKAERKKAKLRLGLTGVSGSGKTYSALLIASGIFLSRLCGGEVRAGGVICIEHFLSRLCGGEVVLL